MTSGLLLVTGGAGFIGSHLVDDLVARGRHVRVLDVLEPQVHGSSQGYRNERAEYVIGSVLDRAVLDQALDGVAAVVHLAAQVGVGQSMYEMSRYVRENSLGTAVLLEAIAARAPLDALVVASSMSLYGEGQYACDRCGAEDAQVHRTPTMLRARQWEPVCLRCQAPVRPVPTTESKRSQAESVYAITKRDQEELALVFGRAYGVRTVALRFFNVYGPRQSLANPYTGAAAIFASRLLGGEAPEIFEDGKQTRDFIHVTDVVGAVRMAMENAAVGDVALNVGTGVPTTILELAEALARGLDREISPRITNRFRHGDIRHCYADPTAAEELLGFRSTVTLSSGMRELIGWIRDESPAADDRSREATRELADHGLVL